jgi:SAM-dependent methyltransferase
MKFKGNFLKRYLEVTPVALAFERYFECEIYCTKEFQRPILDVGCGDGLFSHMLFDEKIDLGIDPQAHEIESARGFAVYKELIQCYGDKIPRETGSFKTIFSNSVLEHIPDLDPVLVEMHRLLADDGCCYVTVPSNYFDKYSLVHQFLSALGLTGLAKRFSAFYNNFWRHYHFYDIAGWKKKFGDAGFDVVYVEEYCQKKYALFNDIFTVPAVPSLVVKKLINRWILIPRLRKAYSWIFEAFLKWYSSAPRPTDPGGIVFFKLVKRGGN